MVRHNIQLNYLTGAGLTTMTKGFSEAAEFYFHKQFQELSEDEYISLVAMCIGCGTYNIIRNPKINVERVGRIKKVLSGEYVPQNMTTGKFTILTERLNTIMGNLINQDGTEHFQ